MASRPTGLDLVNCCRFVYVYICVCVYIYIYHIGATATRVRASSLGFIPETSIAKMFRCSTIPVLFQT